MYESN